MIRRNIALILIICLLASVVGCGQKEEPAPQKSTEMTYPTFTFTHFASGGSQEDLEAVILFEQSNSTFTAYQVAFVSCTCRDPMNNYYSVAYVEILNNQQNADDASIRYITFGGYKGLFGDGNAEVAEFSEEHVDKVFTSKLIGKTYAELKNWGGYGSILDGMDVDALTGATVTTSNITSMLVSLMEYHADKYYSGK